MMLWARASLPRVARPCWLYAHDLGALLLGFAVGALLFVIVFGVPSTSPLFAPLVAFGITAAPVGLRVVVRGR